MENYEKLIYKVTARDLSTLYCWFKSKQGFEQMSREYGEDYSMFDKIYCNSKRQERLFMKLGLVKKHPDGDRYEFYAECVLTARGVEIGQLLSENEQKVLQALLP